MKRMPKGWKKGWKVVSFEYRDSWRSMLPMGREVTYTRGEITERPPSCGPLAVFKTIDNALSCMEIEAPGSPKKLHVVRVRYQPSPTRRLYALGNVWPESYMPPGSDYADKVYVCEEGEDQGARMKNLPKRPANLEDLPTPGMRCTMTRADLHYHLLNTPQPTFYLGIAYAIAHKHLGVGVYEVWLRPWVTGKDGIQKR